MRQRRPCGVPDTPRVAHPERPWKLLLRLPRLPNADRARCELSVGEDSRRTLSSLLRTTQFEDLQMAEKFQMRLPPQTLSSESPRIRGLLERARKYRGFISNHFALMANSPGLLETTLTGYKRFRKESGFTLVEQETVFLTI